MYPSRVISDQYSAVRVDTRDLDVFVGMLADETESKLTLIDATGQRVEIPKEDIVERSPSDVSIMPEGLLDVMSLKDLVDLMTYLEQGFSESPEDAVPGAGAGARSTASRDARVRGLR